MKYKMQLTLLTKPFCAGAWGKNFKSTDVFTKPTVNSSPLSIAFDLQPSNIFHEYIRTTSIPMELLSRDKKKITNLM